jgi:hypothetical protein
MIYIKLRPRLHSFPMLSGYQPVEKLILFVVFYLLSFITFAQLIFTISYSLTLVAITSIR